MAGINPVPLFRWLATRRPLHLGIAYAAVASVVMLLQAYLAARPQAYAVRWLMWLLAVGGFSILVTVFAWYRDDDLVETSVLLLAITGIGTIVAQSVTSIVLTGSLGGAIIMAVPALLLILVRLVVMSPFVIALLWLLRKGRHWFAPDTEAAT